MRRLALSLTLGFSLLFLAAPAPAVTITIVNQDSAGQGLNDPTPATPVGGNSGTTIGQQRLNVFKEAARIWGQILPGHVETRIDASFPPLDCTSDSAVLGLGGPSDIFADFAGAPVAGTWYVVSEANQLAGHDLNPGQSHLNVQFNSKLGETGCLGGTHFYYGFDTNTPFGDVNLLTVALHEFAHGLGFISLADESTGELCCTDPNTGQVQLQPDIFDAFVYDTTIAKSWNEMTSDADRQASAINTAHLVWKGPAANAAGAAYLDPRAGMNANGQMLLYAPSPVQVGSNVSHWDTSAHPNLLMEPRDNRGFPIGVDITPALFADIGWFGPVAPVADFTFFSATPKAGQRVQFTDTSTGQPNSWSWDLGDGGTSSDQNPVHTFSKGTYAVSLTVSNEGGSTTRTQTVAATWSSPVACTADTYTMCMVNGRYKVTSHWKNQYVTGSPEAALSKAALTDATGAFWILDPADYEYLIRINAATDNGKAWISIPTFTDVEFWIAVFDTQAGFYREYHSEKNNRTMTYDPYFFVYP